MKTSSLLFCVAICVVLAAQTSSAQTVAVGNCRPHLVSYSTISAAVAAVAPNSTVLVCPGTYPEQVTITQSLTLRGVNDGTGGNPVITVPRGGLVGNPAQLSVAYISEFVVSTVDIANFVVDGADSGFDCSTSLLAGIYYDNASGSLDNVEVRNQNPGGCGVGIWLIGGPTVVDTVNIRNSSIHHFDDTGILAGSPGSTGFLVNVASSLVASASPSVQAGVGYFATDGLAAHNTIVLAGGTGLQLENFYCCMTAWENTIIGANVGILSGSNEGGPDIIVNNSLSNNGTGIAVSGIGAGAVVNSNSIVRSSIAAIDLNCSQDSTVERNTIFHAPLGIANVTSEDTVKRNVFYSVPALTTECQ
ncbi:MAG: hypothetical protein WCA13_03050 [Terriglobales bacterium]